VNFIEIRRGTQVLILARPGVLPKAARAASDRQRLPGMVAQLGRDIGAMAIIRVNWFNVFPSVMNIAAMSDTQLAKYVSDALAAHRVEAALLRDGAVPLSPVEVDEMQHAFANARVERGQIIVAQHGALPPAARTFTNPAQVVQLLGAMQDSEEGAVILDRQAGRLTKFGLGALRGRPLRTGIIAKINQRVLDAAYIPPGPAATAAGSHPSAGASVATMGPGDKVAAALQRSLPHLSGEVQAAVAEMVTPTNLVIMAGIFVAVALANTNPVTGAAVDSILLGVAWFIAGLTGVYALGDFIDATVSAIKAKSEPELDEAGKIYAKALVGMGSALIQAIMARFLTKKGGTVEEGAGKNAPAEPRPADPARTGAQAEAASSTTRVGSYKDMTAELKGTGEQAHHLNQDAAFRDVIPRDEGLAVGMRGNAFKDVGSPHYEVHSSLESFWQPYRKGGDFFGSLPTNAEYGTAVEQALMQSGYSASEAANVAAQATAQRTGYGLLPSAPVPRIPGRLPQVGR
jgi:hypothetical protein